MAGKTFRFSLQSVLDLRRREAEEAEQALGRAVQKRRAHEERLDAASRERAAACAGAPEGPLDTASLRRRSGFLDDLRRREADAARRLGEAQRQESVARRVLAERRRPEEALKVLRTQEADAHRHARNKAEAAFLDEQAALAHRRSPHASRP